VWHKAAWPVRLDQAAHDWAALGEMNFGFGVHGGQESTADSFAHPAKA
jgi:hypothetical protein